MKSRFELNPVKMLVKSAKMVNKRFYKVKKAMRKRWYQARKKTPQTVKGKLSSVVTWKLRNLHDEPVSLGKITLMHSVTNSSWLCFTPYENLGGDRNELKKELFSFKQHLGAIQRIGLAWLVKYFFSSVIPEIKRFFKWNESWTKVHIKGIAVKTLD